MKKINSNVIKQIISKCSMCGKSLIPYEEILLGDAIFCEKCSELYVQLLKKDINNNGIC